jgi:epoxyqueuosine reductase
MSLTDRIKEKALELGFLRLGIARAETLPRSGFLDLWLQEKKHGDMSWMERTKEKRKNPELVLPGVRTLFVVGLNYFIPDPPGSQEVPRISRYAWGEDYHRIMKNKLSDLTRFLLTQLPGSEAIFYSDTGPVMEKAWAEKAGLGWIGKNTNLIMPDHGSYLFLGVILLNREWESYDTPGTDLCGSCTLCLQACPTEALTPYAIDSTKCISYLTIEKKGAFTAEEGEAIGPWAYGCDDCQEICPWNASPKVASEPGFSRIDPSIWRLSPFTLTENSFSRLFKESAIKRLKYAGLKRNLLAVSQNVPSDLSGKNKESAA